MDGFISSGDVVKAEVKRSVLPRQFLQSSHDDHHVISRALGSKSTLLLRQNVLVFAVVTRTTRDDVEEYFARVYHDGDATIVATFYQIFLLVQHLNRRTFALLCHATSSPHSYDDLVKFPNVSNSP